MKVKPVKPNTGSPVSSPFYRDSGIVEVEMISWEKAKTEYDECSELLAIFSSIGKK